MIGGYYLGTAPNPSGTESFVSTDASDLLYYPHQTANFNVEGQEKYCEGYWLSSPCALFVRNLMRIGANGFVSDRDYGDKMFGIRPVVCLKANAKLIQTDDEIGIPNSECYEIQL